jgi:predicted component of type VI protein secretion system
MPGKLCLYLLGFLTVVLLTGCGGGSYSNMQPAPGPQSAQMSLSVTDAPPTGVTVFSFEVTVTGATLNPGNVDLLGGKGPVRLEVKKLETENAFLSTASVAAGNYTSLALTFSNPELTFRNDTGSPLAGCATGSVCDRHQELFPPR